MYAHQHMYVNMYLQKFIIIWFYYLELHETEAEFEVLSEETRIQPLEGSHQVKHLKRPRPVHKASVKSNGQRQNRNKLLGAGKSK